MVKAVHCVVCFVWAATLNFNVTKSHLHVSSLQMYGILCYFGLFIFKPHCFIELTPKTMLNVADDDSQHTWQCYFFASDAHITLSE